MLRASFYFSIFLWLIVFEVNSKRFLVKTKEDANANDTANEIDINESIKSQDYSLPHFPTQKAKLGGKTTLNCTSPIPFQGCKFRSPSGQIYNIGIGGGSSYDRSRIDCLCTEKEYDPEKVCGIFIKDLTRHDTGKWSCLLDYKRGGVTKTKTATTYLDVENEIKEPGSGEYIQKNEIDLKPNNLIAVLPNLGSEYKIIFDVLIHKYKRNTWYIVLLGTADGNMKGYGGKYGDRLPAVWIYNDFVWTAISINDDVNLYNTPAYVTVGKWMKIEICQHMKNNKLTFEVKINGKSKYKVVNHKPCLFKGVNMYAGQPNKHLTTAPGKIKNLYYETSDEANKGQCVVDFRSCTNPVYIGRLTQDWISTSVFCYKDRV